MADLMADLVVHPSSSRPAAKRWCPKCGQPAMIEFDVLALQPGGVTRLVQCGGCTSDACMKR